MKQFVKILFAEMRKQHKNYFHSKIIYVSLFIWPFLNFVTTYYSFKAFNIEKSKIYYITAENMVVYLLLGYMCMSFFRSLVQSAWGFSFERISGTLELIYLSPANRGAVLLGNAVSSLFESIFVMLIFSLLVLIMNKNVLYVKILPFIAVFLVMTAMAVVWGMFLNSLFLFSRDSDFLFTILEEPMEIFSGVKVPTVLFPMWAKAISVIFPLTYAIEAVRKVILTESTPYEIRRFAGVGILIITVLLMLISAMIKIVEKHMRITGNITLF